jgi:hypothetical protein
VADVTRAPEPPDRSGTRAALGIAGAALALYALLPAAIINGDGLYYHEILMRDPWWRTFRVGHLLYAPGMSLLWSLVSAIAPVSLYRVMLVANQLAGAFAVYLLYRTADQLGLAPFGRAVASAGLAISYGFWIQASDVETYALSVVLVVASMHRMAIYLARPRLRSAAELGVLNGLATLLHLTSATLAASSVLLILGVAGRPAGGRVRALLAYGAVLAAVVGVPYVAVAALIESLKDPGRFFGWILSAGHGYVVTFDALSVPRAVYGFARTFLFLEFFYGGPRWVIAVKGGVLLAAALWIAWRVALIHGRAPHAVPRFGFALAPFLLLQAAVGVRFFGSDTERWIFIAPAVWLALGAWVPAFPARVRAGMVGLLVLLFAVNLVQGIWPLATDTQIQERVVALRAVLPEKALVITPGQDWFDYYRYFTGRDNPRISLIDLALRHGRSPDEFWGHLRRSVEEARQAGTAVVLLRVLDADENIRGTPWPELAAFGFTPERIREWAGTYTWVEQRLGDGRRTRIYWLR